jgi:MFS family permease
LTIINENLPLQNLRIGRNPVNEFRRGWKILVASLLGVMFASNSVEIFTIGLFSPHLSAEFGWSQQQVLLSFMIANIAMLASLPLVGPAVDRIGARPVAIIGQIGFAVPFASLCWLQSSLTQFYIVLAIGSFFGGGSLPIVWTRIIAMWFDRHLGFAIGLALLGIGLSGAVLKPVTAFLIASFGWRMAYLGIGLLPLLIALPIILIWFKEPPVGAKHHRASDMQHSVGASLSDALRDWRFWVLAISFVPIGGSCSALITNMETLLATDAIEPSKIVGLVSSIGLGLLLGRFFGGWLMDHIRASVLGASLVAGLAFACIILTMNPLPYELAFVVVWLVGFGTGVESDVAAYLAIRMFGPRSYGKIGSIITVFSYGSGAITPFLFARALDRHGSYVPALLVAFSGLMVSTILLLSIGKARPGNWSAVSADTVDPEELTPPISFEYSNDVKRSGEPKELTR